MVSRAQFPRGLLTLSLLLAGGAEMNAQLASKSPFMPPAASGAASPTAGAPLEYRGMMQTSKGLRARIVDPARHTGVWLLANERDPSFDAVVKQIDVEHDTVTVDYQGRSLTLAQHVAKVASAGTAQMPIGPPAVASNMPAAISQSVVVNPTPADEQRRLEAVASEVARRRQLREQASQQVAQGVPVAPQVIQQQQQQIQAQQQQALQNGVQPTNASNNLRQQRGNGNQRPRGNQP
jgi:hypothetical protein